MSNPMPQDPSSRKNTQAAVREDQIVALRLRGHSFVRISSQVGMSKPGAIRAYYRAMRKLAAKTEEKSAVLRVREGIGLDQLEARAWERMETVEALAEAVAEDYRGLVTLAATLAMLPQPAPGLQVAISQVKSNLAQAIAILLREATAHHLAIVATKKRRARLFGLDLMPDADTPPSPEAGEGTTIQAQNVMVIDMRTTTR
jgi:hypothetical protein